MIPILFESNETAFAGHGLGDLIDCVSCESAVNDEGEYELVLEYPVGSELFTELKINRIVLAKVNNYQGNQAFRIYGYEKEIKGIIKIKCEHLSYDLRKIPTKDFKDKTTCSSALATMKTNAVVACPFNFITDIPDTDKPQIEENKFKIEVPQSIRACLLDGDDSIKGCWGGDLVFDNYNVSLLKIAGEDRGTVIEYGIDLIDMEQEENISEMITAVLPYYHYNVENESTGDSTSVVTYGAIQYAEGTFDRQNIKPVDLTEQFPNQTRNTAPSAAQLNAKAKEWMTANDIGKPEINLTLSYAAFNQDVRLHDVVTVKFLRMGVDVKSKVTSYKYDVLNERVVEIEVGKTKASDIFSLEDASRLRKGLIPPKRIGNGSISGDKLGRGSVGGKNVAGGGIDGWHLRDGAVGEDQLDDEAVSEEKIKSAAVTVNKIKDGAVVSTKIEDGAVTTNKVLNKAIELAKLSQSLQVFYADTIAANNVVANWALVDGDLYTANAHIQNLKCTTLTVNGTKYASGTITGSSTFNDGYKTYALTSERKTGTTSDGATFLYLNYDLTSGTDYQQKTVSVTSNTKVLVAQN